VFAASVNCQNVTIVIRSNLELIRFTAFLDSLGISPGLGETIFAPSNDAFDKYGTDCPRLWELYQEPEWCLHLREILLWQLVTEGAFTNDQVFDGTRTEMENAKGNIVMDQNINTFDGLPRALISEPNMTASDGIVHVVSQVLIPPLCL
jgi:uncharacterized surface protein with fasciclin (FAS1) repeats